MPYEILMPKLGLTMKTGTIVNWLKSEGDQIIKKNPLLEIETEKLSYSVESPATGILLKILAVVGEKYPVSTILGYIGQPDEVVPDNHMDYKQGSNPEGQASYSESAYPPSSAPQPHNSVLTPSVTITPYKGLRRSVGNSMSKAWTTIPMVTHHVSCDAGKLINFLTMLNADISDKNEHTTIGELILKLTATAISMTPIINSSLTDKGLLIHECVNIGMAMALGDGLVIPVIRDADKKDLLTLCNEAKALVSHAISGTLTPDDCHGATFTVSNLGDFDSVDNFSSIINPPQAAILGIGRVTESVVPIEGEIMIRPMIGLSITYDHRIIDGATAAKFINTIMALMDNPLRSLL